MLQLQILEVDLILPRRKGAKGGKNGYYFFIHLAHNVKITR
jgi:hypothetical protein